MASITYYWLILCIVRSILNPNMWGHLDIVFLFQSIILVYKDLNFIINVVAEQSADKKMRRYIDASLPVIEYIDKLYLARNIVLDWWIYITKKRKSKKKRLNSLSVCYKAVRWLHWYSSNLSTHASFFVILYKM